MAIPSTDTLDMETWLDNL